MQKNRYEHPDNQKFFNLIKKNKSINKLLPFASSHIKDRVKEKIEEARSKGKGNGS